MASRGQVSEDMAYVLLDMPLVPRLDLSDCRPTELPALSETTPTQPPDSASQGSVGRQAGAVGGFSQSQVRPLSAGANEKDRTPTLPPAPVPVPRGIKAQLPATEVVRTLVVDMRDLNKITAKHTNSSDNNNINHKYNNDEDDSSDEIILEEPLPARSAKRTGGVLKGGGDYVSSGEPRPRPRVSFLLDAAPGQGPDGGGSMQIRVYAKPPQIPHPDVSHEEEASIRPNGSSFDQHYHPPPHHQHHQRMGGRPYVDGVVLPTGVSTKRFRRYGSADRRHCASSYRKQISQMQADARLHEAYAAASRSAEGAYRLKPRFHDDYSARTSAPQLPTVSHGGSQSARRMPLFTFKRKSSTDSLLDTQTIITRDAQGRRHVMMSHSGGSRHTKGHHRFHEDPGGERVVSREEFTQLHSRHAEPRHVSASMGNVGSYNIPDPPPPPPPRGGPSGKPPIPRPHVVVSADSVDSSPGPRPPRVTSASSRSGRVREWLSVDSVPNYRHKPRPSTVSSASSSTRSRDIHSAQQRLAGPSSRVSSASLKTASDPGPELENMDPVTLNLMARRCKGPSRYRYLAKLKALNLNTPRPLV